MATTWLLRLANMKVNPVWRCIPCDTIAFTSVCPFCGATELESRDRLESECRDEVGPTYVPLSPLPVPPVPFRRRLAAFLNCDESNVMTDTENYRSNMPFRIFGLVGPYLGAKSIGKIRYHLKRIHQAVSSGTVRFPTRYW